MFYNGPLDWGSRMVRVICHSSAEVEISAGCIMAKRFPFILQLLSDMQVKIEKPVICFLDNTAALALAERMGASPKTAHFLRWQFYLRKMVVDKFLSLLFAPTSQMIADPLTKVVDLSTLNRFIGFVFNHPNRFLAN